MFDFADVAMIDTTAAKALEAFVHKLRRVGTEVCIAGARIGVRRTLLSSGFHEPEVHFSPTVQDARERTRIKRQDPASAILAKGLMH